MKKFLAILLAVAMVAALCACGAQPAAAPAADTAKTEAAPAAKTEAAPAAAAEEHENVTIEVYIAQVDWADAWDVMEERFEEQYPWIDVEHVGLGTGSEFISERLAAKDLPDVIQQNRNDVMDQMVADGLLTDISGYDCAKYMPDAYKDAYSYDGKFVGMCQGAAFSCFFYNMDILNAAGWTEKPANLDELLQCCADIAEKTDAKPLTVAAGKTTTSWMLFELLLANWTDGFERAPYEAGFLDGTFNFDADPAVAEKLQALAPYFLEGTASAQEEDVAAYMGDGLAAMCIAGNWNGTQICDAITAGGGTPAASLPPLGQAGKPVWISVSPEDAFCVTENPDRTPAEQEAVDTFFNWVFEAENFALIQNARGTVPVTTNMTEEYIVLPESVIPVVADMGVAPFIKMGFNFWIAEFKESACGMIKGVISGDNTAAEATASMAELIGQYHK